MGQVGTPINWISGTTSADGAIPQPVTIDSGTVTFASVSGNPTIIVTGDIPRDVAPGDYVFHSTNGSRKIMSIMRDDTDTGVNSILLAGTGFAATFSADLKIVKSKVVKYARITKASGSSYTLNGIAVTSAIKEFFGEDEGLEPIFYNDNGCSLEIETVQ